MGRLLPVTFMLLVFPCCAFADTNENAANIQVNPKESEEAKTLPPIKKWYAGGGAGIAELEHFDLDTDPVHDYYNSLGYYNTGGSSGLFMIEAKIYVGYRMHNYMNIELGYSNSSKTISKTFKNSSGEIIWSRREIEAEALYIAALFRPPYDGYGNGLYCKLGGHVSNLKILKTVEGSPANLNTIAAGDRLPADGTSGGVGSLIGLGFDFRTGKIGAVRLEVSSYYRLGGTPYKMNSLNVGYLVNF